MAKIKVTTNPVANKYASNDERIIEYYAPIDGQVVGGLISFRVIDNRLVVSLYRHDEAVDIHAGPAS